MANRKDKETLSLFEGQMKDIRLQLSDQLKCLDQRMEQQVAILGELQDFFKRKADAEIEYSKTLERLAKNLQQKQKSEKLRREQWPLCSVFSLYQTLIQVTRKQSRDHAVLGELYASNLMNRLNQTGDDLTRIYKRCRDIGVESHEELFKVHNELHTALKTYFLCLNDCRQCEVKYRAADEQRMKTESAIPKEKQARNRKLKVWIKEAAKKQVKFDEAKAKLLKARNEYLLSLNSANAALHKYFAEDLPELMDCMDFGLHRSVASALKIHQQAVEQLALRNAQYELEVKHCIDNFDSRADKQKLIENNHAVFMLPRKFDFHSQIGDEVRDVTNDPLIQDELVLRFMQLSQRITTLRTENEEIWKTLDTAERTLIGMIDLVDCDVDGMFSANGPASFSEERRLMNESITNGSPAPPSTPVAKVPETAVIKKKADKAETEQFYLLKFQEYTINSNLMTRLQAKQKLLQNALGSDVLSGKTGGVVTRNQTLPPKPRRRRIAQLGSASQRPKLFGGSLEEYIEATGQEIPVIIKSCIRVIRQYGLHHQGIFRVSGSQVEINNFRDAFERGEDPLADVCDGSDINSIAGVFKLYLRELREPLFPLYMFDQLMEISKMDAKEEFVKQIRELLMSLPRSVFIVLRYLIAFLNHLSEFSDENMMDRYNLAICFGPTLLPIPESRDQVQYQQWVNILIKNIFLYQDDIFPQNFGTIYEKYDLDDAAETTDLGSTENLSDDEVEPTVTDASEEDLEQYEATAIFDFTARTPSELTVRKGNPLLLIVQINSEWWKAKLLTGTMAEGLIPDKYIDIKRRVSKTPMRNGGFSDAGFDLQTSITDSLGSTGTSSGTASDDSVTAHSMSTLDLSPRTSPSQLLASAPADTHKSDDDESDSSLKILTDQLFITEKTPRETWEERRRKDQEHDRHSFAAEASYPVQTTPIPPSPRSPRILSSPLQREPPRYYFGGVTSSSPLATNRRLYEAFTSVAHTSHAHEEHADTPDLVMNLPVKSGSPSSLPDSSRPLPDHSPGEGTVAERFARSNQGTMKKGDTKLGTVGEEAVTEKKVPNSPNLNNFSLNSYEDRKMTPSKYERKYSDPAASVDELLESLKAFTSPSVGSNESPRPAVAPKPTLKSKPHVTQKPVLVAKKSNNLDGGKAARDVSKPTSC